jgi:hypothetical protein
MALGAFGSFGASLIVLAIIVRIFHTGKPVRRGGVTCAMFAQARRPLGPMNLWAESMSCWVVPSLAADIWHIPLEQLWRRIRDGQIPTHEEDGFTFVDMAPCGPKIQRPPTFTLAESDPTVNEQREEEEKDEEEDERGPEDHTASVELGDWRAARKKVSRLRVPPRRMAPSIPST